MTNVHYEPSTWIFPEIYSDYITSEENVNSDYREKITIYYAKHY